MKTNFLEMLVTAIVVMIAIEFVANIAVTYLSSRQVFFAGMLVMLLMYEGIFRNYK